MYETGSNKSNELYKIYFKYILIFYYATIFWGIRNRNYFTIYTNICSINIMLRSGCEHAFCV